MNELLKLFIRITGDNQEAVDAINETSDTAEKSEGRMSKAFSSIGSAAIKMGEVMLKTAATVASAAAAGFSALTKSSVENYAEYEQLVGGVNKMFGDASERVIEQANYAYKSAGLSANEYMETVTSFSASLLQGLNGNTWQAAEVANMAIRDMADNANTYGTSMESIQNAYQAFAKGQFQLLDNLKIGYGGTQEEMIRLINDSGVLNEEIKSMDGISFDTIINAIHAVQENLNITKTTSREAATTIQGSVSAMKSAWQNFITGMADENQDFDALTGSLVESIITVVENIAPRLVVVVPRLLDGLKEVAGMLADYLPEIIGEMFPGAEEGISALAGSIKDTIQMLAEDVLPEVFNMVSQLLPPLLQMGAEILPMIIDTIKLMLPSIEQIMPSFMLLVSAILPVISELMQAILPAVTQIVEALLPILVELIDILLPPVMQIVEAVLPIILALLDPIVALLNPLLDLLQPLIDALQPILDLAVALLTPLTEILTAIMPPLMESVSIFATMLTGSLSGAIEIVAGILESQFGAAFENIMVIVDTARTVFTEFMEFFSNVFAGNWSDAWDNIKNIFSSVWDGIKAIFKNTVNGIIGGVESLINGVIKAINGMLDGIGTVVDKVGDVLGLDWDLPTLSEVSLPKLAKGGILEQGQVGLLEGDGAEAVVPLENNRKWISSVSEEMNVQGIGGGKETLNVLQQILAVLAELKESNDELPDALTESVSRLKFSINDREFARLVKAVG